MARSSSLARDTLFLGYQRKLDDVRSAIDGLTVDKVQDFVVEFAPSAMVLCTIGPDALNPECVASAGVTV